jgi:branched-chain amino acid transport system permease protein
VSGAAEPGAGAAPAAAPASGWEVVLRSALPIAAALPMLAGAQALVPEGSYALKILYDIGVAIILAVSLNVVNGFTGQFSIGHAGFMAVGAYAAAYLTLAHRSWAAAHGHAIGAGEAQAVFLGALLFGALLAAAAGLVVGIPSLRLKGDYLAIVTLGFGEIIRVVIEQTEALGAQTGLSNIPPYATLFWVYFFVVVTVLVARRVLASSHGRALLAIREDEVAAEAMGVDTTGYKVRAFAIAAFFAGIAGGLFGHYLTTLGPRSFTFIKSFEIVVMVVLGGLGSISGSILSATVLTVLPELLRSFERYRMTLYAVLLIGLMLTRPTGLFGAREIWEVAGQWLARRRQRGAGGGR